MPVRIIKFERQPDFYYSRAVEKRKERDLTGALELILKAISGDPVKPEYLIELAEIYTELEMELPARHALTLALAYGNDTVRAMIAIAANLFTEGRIQRCKAVLNACDDSRAKRIMSDVMLADELSTPYNRKARRARRWGLLSCDFMESGDFDLAVRCLEIYTRIKPGEPGGHMMLAKALAAQGRHKRAISEADCALNLCNSSETKRIACMYAQVMTQTGHPRKAKQFLIKAAPDYTNISELMNYIYALAAAEEHGMIYSCAKKCLEGGCMEASVLNALSVSAVKLKKSAEEAEEGWNRILSFDPGCSEAVCCLDKYRSGQMNTAELTYLWTSDPDIKTTALNSMCAKTGEQLISAAARALNADDDRALLALSLLMSMDDPVADRILCLASVRPDITDRIRSEARKIVEAKNLTLPEEFLPFKRACRKSCDEIVPEVDARSAHIIIGAAEYDINRDIAARIWKRFLDECGSAVTLNADAACAALICASKKKVRLKPDYRQLMRDYGLRPRQLKRVLMPLYKANGISEDFDNAF